MKDKNNLYSNIVNFYNVNDENFIQFMADIYEEMINNHRDVKYIKEHLSDEIEKKLEKYLVDGKFDINIEEKVNTFLENSKKIKDIKSKLDKKAEKTYVTYEEFGAKLDGVSDDSVAIINCHNYANQNNLSVIQNGGKVKCNFTVEVKTDCNLKVEFLIDDTTPNTVYQIVSDNEEDFTYNTSFTDGQINNFDNIFKGKFFVPRLNNDKWLLGRRSMEPNGEIYYHRQPIAIDKNSVLLSSPIYLGNDGDFTIKYCKDLSEKSITFSGGRVITNLSKIGFPRLVKCSRNNTVIKNITIENTKLPTLKTNYPSGLIEIIGCANTTINNIFGTNNAVNTTDTHSYVIDITECYNVNISNVNLTQGWGVIATHFVDNVTITNSVINRVDNHYGLFGGFKFCNSTLTGVSVLCAGYGNGDFIVDNVSINKTLKGSYIFYTRTDFNITYSGTLSLNRIKFNSENFDRIVEYQIGTGTANTNLSKGKFNVIANEITTTKAIISNTTNALISAQLFNIKGTPATSVSKVDIDIFNSKVSQLSSTGTIRLYNSILNSINKYESTLYAFSSLIYANINNNSIIIYATSCLIGNNITGKSLYLTSCYATSPKTVTATTVNLQGCINISQQTQ